MDIKEIQTFLDANKEKDEIKTFINGFYTPDRLNPILDSPEGGKLLQPRYDKHFAKSLDTWKEKNLPSLIDEEVKKRNPAETEEQKRIRKIEKELEDSKNAALRSNLKNIAISKLTDLKIPVKFADLVIGTDEASTLENIKLVQENWDAEINKRVDEKFKANGRKKPGEKPDAQTINTTMNAFIRKGAGYTN